MKKLRGGRRYYRALTSRAESFRIDLSETSWYDLWHTHFDWCGYGRRGRRHRRPHLEALFTAFGRALDVNVKEVVHLRQPLGNASMASVGPSSHVDDGGYRSAGTERALSCVAPSSDRAGDRPIRVRAFE